jgi:hypothetical protein
VDRALTNALREVAKCLTNVNKQAGAVVARGNYTDAEALVAAGKAIDSFQLRLDSLRREWRSIRTLSTDEEGDSNAPLWRAYEPILRALISLGGSASKAELAKFLGSSAPEDPDHEASETEWKRRLGRARRHLVREGFLDANPSIWRITEPGRQAVSD